MICNATKNIVSNSSSNNIQTRHINLHIEVSKNIWTDYMVVLLTMKFVSVVCYKIHLIFMYVHTLSTQCLLNCNITIMYTNRQQHVMIFDMLLTDDKIGPNISNVDDNGHIIQIIITNCK